MESTDGISFGILEEAHGNCCLFLKLDFVIILGHNFIKVSKQLRGNFDEMVCIFQCKVNKVEAN